MNTIDFLYSISLLNISSLYYSFTTSWSGMAQRQQPLSTVQSRYSPPRIRPSNATPTWRFTFTTTWVSFPDCLVILINVRNNCSKHSEQNGALEAQYVNGNGRKSSNLHHQEANATRRRDLRQQRHDSQVQIECGFEKWEWKATGESRGVDWCAGNYFSAFNETEINEFIMRCWKFAEMMFVSISQSLKSQTFFLFGCKAFHQSVKFARKDFSTLPKPNIDKVVTLMRFYKLWMHCMLNEMKTEWIEPPMNNSFQILHVIDDVLIPLSTGNRSSNDIFNPDALTFLTNANSFDIGSHRVRSFYQRVVVNKKESLFQADGFHTFFIPVEEGFKVRDWQ